MFFIFFKYDVADEMVQQEYSNIKFYISAFRYIYKLYEFLMLVHQWTQVEN